MSLGRPKKNQTLTTLETLNPEDYKGEVDHGKVAADNEELSAFTAEPVETPLVLKNLALSILRNPANQRWMLVSIAFDYATKTFGEMKVIEENTDRIEIAHRYRVVTGTEFMGEV